MIRLFSDSKSWRGWKNRVSIRMCSKRRHAVCSQECTVQMPHLSQWRTLIVRFFDSERVLPNVGLSERNHIAVVPCSHPEACLRCEDHFGIRNKLACCADQFSRGGLDRKDDALSRFGCEARGIFERNLLQGVCSVGTIRAPP